jgi:rubredoxin-NAD+ reductase
MSNSSAPVVIIGSGLAGYNLAKELRKVAPEQNIVMITADDGRNYSKPMLSTGYGKNKSADELAMNTAAGMTIRTNTLVTEIDTDAHLVKLGEESVEYSKLVIGWGAEAIHPHVEGDANDLIFSINDLEDYGRFRAAADGKKRVLIMGAGLIGCEFANDMTVGDQVFPTLLPEEAANAVQAGLEGIGVKFNLGPLVSRVNRDGEGVIATLSTGEEVKADVVVSAIGLRPRIDLAAKAGIRVNRGIVADRTLKTNVDDVYTLGDCAEVEGRVLLYVLPLMASARALAKTLAGTPAEVSYGVMPVTVKTPACPVVVSPPAVATEGRWIVEQEGNDVQAEFRNEAGDLLGYALTGAKVPNKVALNKELPALMP